MKIYFNNVKNPFLRCKIYVLFSCALSDKLKELGVNEKDFEFEAGIKFVSGEEIRALNKRFRDIDKETDVLSFPLIDFKNERITEKYNILGDIVIYKEQAKLQAKKFGHSVKREICFLALHGFLHLLGYDHIEETDEKEMMSKADEILEKKRVKR